MKFVSPIPFRIAVAQIVLLFLAATSSQGAEQAAFVAAQPDASFRHELEHSIDLGLAWLRANQNTNGWWSTPDDPAVTALALAAVLAEPSGRFRTNSPADIKQGFHYLLACVQPDGSIQRGKLANYNTALSMTVLALSGDPSYNEILRRGRAFLIGSQIDLDEAGKPASRFAGGMGYGDKVRQSDLVNTLTALEALRATEFLVRDNSAAKGRELNWNAAIQFIQNCQNLPRFNTQSWVSAKSKDLGGFVYTPGESKAGGETNSDTGRVALRSYGSISYAGLLSYIYADVKGDDPRVRGVLDWLRSNYTLEENPGMGEQGLYYYFHLMTKGLDAAGVDQIELKDGRRINWRREVAMHLLDLQQRDGSWVNRSNRWWEKDPALVTAYSLLTLEILWRKI